METSSAPAKVFLVGEHAVVYGEPALLCAVDRRVTVTATESSGDDTAYVPDIEFDGVTVSFDDDGTRISGTDETDELAYLREAVEKARSEVGSSSAVEIEVESEVPVGAGLGSSAAVTVATIDAVGRELGSGIETRRVASLAHSVEEEVQGRASPSDTYTSALGGVVHVEPESESDDRASRVVGPDDSDIRFCVGYDGGSAPTGRMVERVSELVEGSRVASDTVGNIGRLCDEALDAVVANELRPLGDTMDMNHGFLESLGVSSTSLSRMVHAARSGGAHGAKITGAGGRGSVVALAPSDSGSDSGSVDEVAAALGVVAEEVYSVGVVEGVRREPSEREE